MKSIHTTKLSEYILRSKEERTRHIDESSPCVMARSNWGNQRGKALKALSELVKVTNDVSNRYKAGIFLCHTCEHNSGSDKPCVNPLHLYFGTPAENTADMGEVFKEEQRERGKRLGVQAREKGAGIFDPCYNDVRSDWVRAAGAAAAALRRGVHNPDNKTRCLEGNTKGGKAVSSQRWISLVDGFISTAANVARRNRLLGEPSSARLLLSDLDAATFLGLGSGRWKREGTMMSADYGTGYVK